MKKVYTEEELFYNAALYAFNQMGEEKIKQMSCFYRNWPKSKMK